MQPLVGNLSEQAYRFGADCADVPATARRTFPTRIVVQRTHQDDGRTPETVAGQWRQSTDSWTEKCDLYTSADRSVDPLLADVADAAVFVCINEKDNKPYGLTRLFYPSVQSFLDEAHAGEGGAYIPNVDKHVYWDEYGPYPTDPRDDQFRHTHPNGDVFASLWQDTSGN